MHWPHVFQYALVLRYSVLFVINMPTNSRYTNIVIEWISNGTDFLVHNLNANSISFISWVFEVRKIKATVKNCIRDSNVENYSTQLPFSSFLFTSCKCPTWKRNYSLIFHLQAKLSIFEGQNKQRSKMQSFLNFSVRSNEAAWISEIQRIAIFQFPLK